MIHVSDDPAVACGEFILRSLEGKKAATLAVSGGSSPRKMFAWMAAQPFDWQNVQLYWVDERCVPPDHADSNFRMTRETLIDRVQLGAVHRIEGERPPEEAASRYAAVLPLQFDVVHLGMGADAHTASLFPGLAEIKDRDGRVAAVYVPKLNAHRVTLLPRMILEAKQVVVLAAGADKSVALQGVLHGPFDPLERPIQLFAEKAEWFIDHNAAKSA